MDISVQCFPENISSSAVPDATFQEAISDYLGQLIVTPEMVAKKIKSMKDNKSHGGWNSAKKTDRNIKQISIPFPRVFNLQLIEGVVSFKWKEGNIKPLFKKHS